MKKKTLAQVTDFDLRLLRVFKTVSECGSFSAAESLLGITRSAISLHMSDLEKRLGCVCASAVAPGLRSLRKGVKFYDTARP
jgi:DNA-binding transcriptional LysR family regulator